MPVEILARRAPEGGYVATAPGGDEYVSMWAPTLEFLVDSVCDEWPGDAVVYAEGSVHRDLWILGMLEGRLRLGTPAWLGEPAL
jgi:hypothetical protein